MTNIRVPVVSVSRLSGAPIAGITAQRLLLVGQKTVLGSTTDGELVINLSNDSSQWDGLGGADSMISAMIRRARAVNAVSQIDAIFLDDAGGGVAAVGTFVVGGTATEDGSLVFTIASKKDFAISIPVILGDSADDVGTALEAAITALVNIPVTAVNVTGTVTLTAINLGTYGNTLGLQSTGTVAGLTVATSAMASGATDPVLTAVFDVIGERRYQGIVWPYTEDLTPLTDLLDARFNADNNLLDGVGFVSKTDTFANLVVYGNAQNSASLCVNGDQLVDTTNYRGPAVLEIPVVKATEFAAIRALRLTNGANIGSFVITSNALDAFGGAASASKPYFNTPLPNLRVVGVNDGFSSLEISSLKDAGIWVLGNNTTADTVITGEVVTTRTNDTAGNPDPTFSFLNYVDTSSLVAEYFFNNYKIRYAQYRLTAGALIQGRDSANPLSIAAFSTQLFRDLGGPDFALVQIGVGELDGEVVDFDQTFLDNLNVSISLVQGLVTVSMTIAIIVQLRTILVPIVITFSPNS